jgi:hypothetical protein
LLPLKQTIQSIRDGLAAERPAPTSDGQPAPYIYRWSVVSYFDVLGMKELLREDDPNKVARVLDVARTFSQPDPEVAGMYDWEFVNFSDLIVRAVPIKGDVNVNHRIGLIFHELLDLANIQLNLLARGVLVRGAVTVGPITVDRGLVFGPALANAYMLESRTAVFPRIVVEDLVLEAVAEIPLLRRHNPKAEDGEIKSLIQQDVDGMWFVDYLGYLFENADDHEQHVQAIMLHKKTVTQQFAEAGALPPGSTERQGRVAKALWLREYHNRHVRRLDADVLKQETGVDLPTLMV